MSEKPKAGEWWTSALPGQTAGLRVFVVGPPCDFDGTDYVVQEEDLEPYERHLGGWRHLPGCTGFDWVEPQPASEEMVRIKLQKWVEPNGRGDFKFLRTDNEHGAGGYTRVNEWMEIEVPISRL